MQGQDVPNRIHRIHRIQGGTVIGVGSDLCHQRPSMVEDVPWHLPFSVIDQPSAKTLAASLAISQRGQSLVSRSVRA